MSASFTPKRLYQGAVLTTSPGSTHPYTVPATTATQVRSLQFVNTTAAPISVTVWLLPTGATADSAHVYIPATAIPAGVNDPDERILVLNAGDALDWQATGAGLNVFLFGAEEGLS